ncbi:hypothetical protein pEaSNUABM50_00435 [Erwinia phage pEa_SNUABM_50]|uniref:Uncharacterized protein n=3 Tax=Eneladusvirus BF TaxID=2560751 RepID=A0A7L8ZQX4_9CAUD|nr:hypothetical protein FDH34_gp489 [Serratia phage BF]QOI71370.1 hypothetical protein pEaSNUABM12_00441 [Erwinia phage pEa_SNUABM_12]QOI72451.1 hypothetical protein pEaSNUABM50_00435 [Erwinia phage pEa_SNUABM_50]QXO11578.1 hypothetical protein pEaSNUABM19_00441 [Erwinia phage pEa_SNUABM_19]QXO12126.1 hypothetical protein pEaSNUABM44_00439 [Erwinia phage pEa_SNUABM_44]QXO12679.1 hypothetical protein pEaSNUABM49_00442 [Erwinia phage pEa_SNUABM_49]
MKKFHHEHQIHLVSPCIELITNNSDYWEVRERLDDNMNGEVSLVWDQYNRNLLNLSIKVRSADINYAEKLDKAIDDLAGYCYDYECNIRIGGEIVRSEV